MSENPVQHPGPVNYQEKIVGNNPKELEEWKKFNEDMNKKKVGRPPKGDDHWRTVGK